MHSIHILYFVKNKLVRFLDAVKRNWRNPNPRCLCVERQVAKEGRVMSEVESIFVCMDSVGPSARCMRLSGERLL